MMLVTFIVGAVFISIGILFAYRLRKIHDAAEESSYDKGYDEGFAAGQSALLSKLERTDSPLGDGYRVQAMMKQCACCTRACVHCAREAKLAETQQIADRVDKNIEALEEALMERANVITTRYSTRKR